MHEHDDDTVKLTLARVKGLLALTLLVGAVAGALGGALFIRYGSDQIPVNRRQVVVQESSATTDVVKKVSPSVVSITSTSTAQSFFGGAQTVEGAGTGMIVSSDGLIMTNKHVVADTAASYSVFTSTGKQYSATVVARDPVNDLAFVRIQAKGLTPVQLGDSSSLVVGQAVVAIGNALGQFQNTATQGIISGLGRPIVAGDSSGSSTENLQDLIQTDAAVNPGNSGGPLVNLEGQVIGMNTAVSSNAQNISFAIPINEIKSQVANVESQGKIITPYLGVRYVPLTKDVAAQNNLPTDQGAYITGDGANPAIVPGSPADKAGLKDGDIITKVASDAVTNNNSLTALISKHKVGETVTLTIIRSGKTLSLQVTFASAPSS